MTSRRQRNQLNYPLWLGLGLFSIGLAVWVSDRIPPPPSPTSLSSAAEPSDELDGPEKKTQPPFVIWEFIGSTIPDKDALKQCLVEQGLSPALVVLGSATEGLTIMDSRLATPVTISGDGTTITLKTFMDGDIYTQTRFHVATSYCLYGLHGRVFDPLLKRTYEKAAWPTLGPLGAAPISYFVTVERIQVSTIVAPRTRHVWQTRGLMRLKRPELAIDQSDSPLDDDQARKLLLVVAARLVGVPADTRVLQLKNFGQIELKTLSTPKDVAEATSMGPLLVTQSGGEPLAVPTLSEMERIAPTKRPGRNKPTVREARKRQPFTPKPKTERPAAKPGFKPDYR